MERLNFPKTNSPPISPPDKPPTTRIKRLTIKTPSQGYFLSFFFFSALALCCFSLLAKATKKRSTPSPLTSDSLYSSLHPRLLFSAAEIPYLQAKVRDGGNDDDAYAFIRILADYIYPGSTDEELLNSNFGVTTIPNLGLATYLETPQDTVSRGIGKRLTLYIADNWDIDQDEYNSSLRLRALALGYDMFFEESTPAERAYVRGEITSYMDTILTNGSYESYMYRPYISNQSAMIASALGLGAVCLDGEIDSSLVEDALARADFMISKWIFYLVDENGTYNEGALYGAWSLRNLVYYFHARKRYDGYNYGENLKIRKMEKWFPYEFLPEGGGKTNNINDSSYDGCPLSQHTTYFDWAQSEWGSSLSAWIWDHAAGQYGFDYGMKSDKTATALWNQNLSPLQPDSTLPRQFLWLDRGLYYFRTGWQSELSSDDVIFSFYSGKFQGGHAQEDQNQFTLYGYGRKFAIDHGIGTTAKQSEAHNIILIDGKGQHNAGSSIGTDGKITRFLLSGYADYLQGDATSAYTTYSQYNAPHFPFPESDWSWGYDGGNPVNFALRDVIVVHDVGTPPYFIILDDIEKDGQPHEYEWRIHTYYSNVVDTSANPIRISAGQGFLDLYVLNPPFASLQKGTEVFNNLNPDPNSIILSLSITDINPRFVFILFPGDGLVNEPSVYWSNLGWGLACTVDWGNGLSDIFLLNFSGSQITYTFPDSSEQSTSRARGGRREETSLVQTGTVLTDASFSLVRFDNFILKRYLVSGTSSFIYNDTAVVSIANGTITAALSEGSIDIDRYDADFTFYAPGISDVYYRGWRVPVSENNGYLTPDMVTSTKEAIPRASFSARAFPNPFNPTTTVSLTLPEKAQVRAMIYDALGRAVRKLWEGEMPSGVNVLRWDGKNNRRNLVPSGVYLLKITAGKRVRTLKLTVLK